MASFVNLNSEDFVPPVWVRVESIVAMTTRESHGQTVIVATLNDGRAIEGSLFNDPTVTSRHLGYLLRRLVDS